MGDWDYINDRWGHDEDGMPNFLKDDSAEDALRRRIEACARVGVGFHRKEKVASIIAGVIASLLEYEAAVKKGSTDEYVDYLEYELDTDDYYGNADYEVPPSELLTSADDFRINAEGWKAQDDYQRVVYLANRAHAALLEYAYFATFADAAKWASRDTKFSFTRHPSGMGYMAAEAVKYWTEED